MVHASALQITGITRRQVPRKGIAAGAQERDLTGAWPSKSAIPIPLTTGSSNPFYCIPIQKACCFCFKTILPATLLIISVHNAEIPEQQLQMLIFNQSKAVHELFKDPYKNVCFGSGLPSAMRTKGVSHAFTAHWPASSAVGGGGRT